MGKNCVTVFVVFSCCLSVLGADTSYGYGLTLNGPKCGQKNCGLSEYCSDFDNTCQPCSVVCDQTSHNYEKSVCEKQCQDYLHDLRYVKNTGSTDDDLRGTVQRLSRMLAITLTLVILMMIILVSVFCFQLYRWKVKKNITMEVIRSKFFKKRTENANSDHQTNQSNQKRDLRLEMPSPTITSDHSPVTVTTSIDRRPAEDSALDYAYDNPAMSKSMNTSY